MTINLNIVDRLHELGSGRESGLRQALVDGLGRGVTFAELSSAITGTDRCNEQSEVVFLLPEPSIACVIEYFRLVGARAKLFLIPVSTNSEQFRKLQEQYLPTRIFGSAIELSRRNLTFELSDYGFGISKCPDGRLLEGESSCEILLSTSGSTGSQQFVRLGPLGVLVNALDIAHSLDLCPEDRAITTLPLSYSFGLSVLHSHLVSGGSILCSQTPILDKGFRNLISENDVTSIYGVPTSYEILEKIGLINLTGTKLTRFAQAGGRMPTDLRSRVIRTVLDRDARLYLMYGQTEATARISILQPEFIVDFPDSVGECVRSGTLGVGTTNDENEIWYKGPNVMLGYCNSRKNLGSGDLLCGVLNTGDTGEMHGDLLYIRGRLKRIAKIDGVRVNMDEIEGMLNVVAPVCVVDLGNALGIALRGRDREWMDHLKDELRKTGILERNLKWIVVDEFPLLSSGKIDYLTLTTL